MRIKSNYLGLEFDLDELDKKYGTVTTQDDIKVYLTQSPYPQGVKYIAIGVNNKGEVYNVFWTLKKKYQKNNSWSDEGDCCNWGKYRVVKL